MNRYELKGKRHEEDENAFKVGERVTISVLKIGGVQPDSKASDHANETTQ